MAQADVTFSTHDAVELRGRLYRPDNSAPLVPGIVMTHGFSATREMGLPLHAGLLAAAGYAVLLYDHRGLGESGGEPRQLIDPFVQARDMMDAVGWLGSQAGIDPARIGVWGTSYSGGEALILGGIDTRVRAVAAIVPMVAWPTPTPDDDGTAFATLARRIRTAVPDGDAATGPHRVVPEPGSAAPALMPDPPTTEWMLRTGAGSPGRWRNTVLTPDWSTGPSFDPQVVMPHLTAPVLMIVGDADYVTPAAIARDAAARAGGMVELIEMPGHHCTFYEGAPGAAAAAAIIDFYRRHL